MDSKIELNCLEALQNQANYITESGDLDPDVCSWNQRRYPGIKLFNLYDKSNFPRPSPKTSPKPTQTFQFKRDLNILSQFQSTSPKGFSGLKKKFHVKKAKTQNFPKINESSEPNNYNRSLRESPKFINYPKYLNKFSLKKIKTKQIASKTTNISFNFADNKKTEIFRRLKSPCLDVKKTPILQNKLPLSNAQTLEELLSSTKLVNINKRYIKYKKS